MTTWAEMWDKKRRWLIGELVDQNSDKYNVSESFLGRFEFRKPDENHGVPNYDEQKTLLSQLEKSGVIKVIKIHDPEAVLKRIYPEKHVEDIPFHNELGNTPFFASIEILQPEFEKTINKYSKLISKYPINLSEYKPIFNDDEASITVGERKVFLPPLRNEHFFCRSLFSRTHGVSIDWSTVYKAITGIDPMSLEENKKKMNQCERLVKDATYAINTRVKKDLNTNDDLFSWKKKAIIRNF